MIKQQNTALRDIDKPHYSYWQAFYLSFYSSRLYVDVGKRWKGLGILYLFLLMLIVTTPFAVRMTHDFNVFFKEQIVEPLQRMPVFYVQNGEVTMDKPMPYLVKNDKGDVVSIIDTTGVIKKIDGKYPHLTTLITKNKFIFRLPSPNFFFSNDQPTAKGTIYIQPISKATNEVFNGDTWVASSGIERLKFLSLVMIYPVIVGMFFSIYMVLFLAFTMMGQLIAQLFFKISISFAQTCRLLMVSSTPQSVMVFLLFTTNFVFKGSGFAILTVLAIYFCFAVLSLKRESHKLVFK